LKAPNPEFAERIRRYLKQQHFMKLIGFELTGIEIGHTYGELVLDADHFQQTGLVHGGVTATLADIVAGFAAYTIVPKNHDVVTAELRVSYLRPGKGTKLVAEGRVIKPGRKLIFCESEVSTIINQQRETIAKSSSVMSIVHPEGNV
jgi:uncharacterized protein (TIGR00369 family)